MRLDAEIFQLCLPLLTRKSDGMCLVKAHCLVTILAMNKCWGFFKKRMDVSEGTLRIELHEIVASDTTVFVLCTVSATRSGQRAEFLEVHVWRIADGRAIEFREFQGDEYAETKFFT